MSYSDNDSLDYYSNDGYYSEHDYDDYSDIDVELVSEDEPVDSDARQVGGDVQADSDDADTVVDEDGEHDNVSKDGEQTVDSLVNNTDVDTLVNNTDADIDADTHVDHTVDNTDADTLVNTNDEHDVVDEDGEQVYLPDGLLLDSPNNINISNIINNQQDELANITPQNDIFTKLHFAVAVSQDTKTKLQLLDPRLHRKQQYIQHTPQQISLLSNIGQHLRSSYRVVSIVESSLHSGRLIEFEKSTYATVFILKSHELCRVDCHYYENAAELLYNPLFALYSKYGDAKNIYATNIFRAYIRANIYNNVNIQLETLIDLSKVASLISSIPNSVYMEPVDVTNIKNINSLRDYYSTIGELSHSQHCICYHAPDTSKSSIDISTKDITNKYKIVQIPSDLQRKFNRIGKYFDEVKKLLKFDKSTGFYSYEYQGQLIPIVCIHEYLALEGVAPARISVECYQDGLCKYCGQEINAYHQQISDILPPRVYDMIFKLIKAINANIEIDSLTFILYNMLYNIVDANISKVNVKNYDASILALSSLFLYKVYIDSKKEISYNNKINDFLDNIMEYCQAVGWDIDQLNRLVQDKTLFAEIDNITGIIKSKIYKNDIHILDSLPLSIMFGKDVAPEDMKNLQAKREIEKLYLMNDKGILHYGIIKYNELMQLKLMELWTNMYLNKLVEDVKSLKADVNIPIINVRVSHHGEKFFAKAWEHYCPQNSIHEWVKDECKHCGIRKNGSNKEEVYLKYESIINNNYMSEPNVLDESRFKIGKLWRFDDYQKYNPNELFTKYIDVKDNSMKVMLEQAMNDGKFIDRARKLISTLTTFDVDKIGREKDVIKKWYCFIVDKNIKESGEMLAELEYLYFPLINIDLLLA